MVTRAELHYAETATFGRLECFKFHCGPIAAGAALQARLRHGVKPWVMLQNREQAPKGRKKRYDTELCRDDRGSQPMGCLGCTRGKTLDSVGHLRQVRASQHRSPRINHIEVRPVRVRALPGFSVGQIKDDGGSWRRTSRQLPHFMIRAGGFR